MVSIVEDRRRFASARTRQLIGQDNAGLAHGVAILSKERAASTVGWVIRPRIHLRLVGSGRPSYQDKIGLSTIPRHDGWSYTRDPLGPRWYRPLIFDGGGGGFHRLPNTNFRLPPAAGIWPVPIRRTFCIFLRVRAMVLGPRAFQWTGALLSMASIECGSRLHHAPDRGRVACPVVCQCDQRAGRLLVAARRRGFGLLKRRLISRLVLLLTFKPSSASWSRCPVAAGQWRALCGGLFRAAMGSRGIEFRMGLLLRWFPLILKISYPDQ